MDQKDLEKIAKADVFLLSNWLMSYYRKSRQMSPCPINSSLLKMSSSYLHKLNRITVRQTIFSSWSKRESSSGDRGMGIFVAEPKIEKMVAS
jgi:hypothetical protein